MKTLSYVICVAILLQLISFPELIYASDSEYSLPKAKGEAEEFIVVTESAKVEAKIENAAEKKDAVSESLYEDNTTTFYPVRYSITKKVVKQMLTDFTSGANQNGVKFNATNIFTTANPEDFKLHVNNMYPYAISAGCESTRIKRNSTAKFHIDLPDGWMYNNERDAKNYATYPRDFLLRVK